MSDLISRNKLIDYFYFGIDDKPIIDGISDRKIIDIIKNQPTAYDIDKVVEELEMEMKASSGYSAERVSAFSRAIEIVKQGCVRNEVAEYV